MLTLLCCLPGASVQASPVTVHEVASVAKIAQTLTAQTGKRIEVRGRVADTVLIVDLDQVPLAEVLQRIGWSTFAKVREEGETLIVSPDADAGRQATRDYRKSIDARNASILKAVQADVLRAPFDDRTAQARKRAFDQWAAVNGTLTESEVERRRQALAGFPLPGERLVARMLDAAKTEDWFDDTGRGVAFSVQPTPRQRVLTRSVEADLDRFREEQDRYVASQNKGLVVASISKVVLTIGQAGMPRPGNAIVTLYGARGNVIDRSMIPLSRYATPEAPPKGVIDAIPLDAPLTLSEASRREMTAWRGRDGRPIRDRLADVERFDPLSTVTADIWRGVARYARKGLVLNLPDQAFITGTGFEKLPSLRDALKPLWIPGTRVEEDCILARPPYPEPAWGWQIRRRTVAGLLKASRSGADRLEAFSEFVAKSGTTHYPYEWMPYFMLVGLDVESNELRNNWDFFAFYAELTSETRAAWRRGGPVRIANAQLNLAECLDRYATYSPHPVNPRPNDTEGMEDPNETMPAKVRDAILTCEPQENWIVRMRDRNNPRKPDVDLTPQVLGRYLKANEIQVGGYDFMVYSQDVGRFFAIYPNGMMSDTQVSMGDRTLTEWGPMDKLPPAILDLIAQGRKG